MLRLPAILQQSYASLSSIKYSFWHSLQFSFLAFPSPSFNQFE